MLLQAAAYLGGDRRPLADLLWLDGAARDDLRARLSETAVLGTTGLRLPEALGDVWDAVTRAGTRGRSAKGARVTLLVPPSSVLRPELRRPLEHFVQAAFSVLAADVARGQEVPFALGGGGGAGGPRLYDYRPLYRAYIEERAERLLDLADGRAALMALEADPGVLAYAETHAPGATRPPRPCAARCSYRCSSASPSAATASTSTWPRSTPCTAPSSAG